MIPDNQPPTSPPMKKLLLLCSVLAGSLAFAAAKKSDEAPASIRADAKRDLAKIFENKLVDADGKPVKSDALAKAKYTLVYFSAHWCPPCRKFTPKLVEFTGKHRKDGNFEVVFVSSDRDEKAMLGYMSETKMTWGGVLGAGADLKDLKNGVSGIPCLRLFDKNGRLVADSFDGENYLGPQHVLDVLEKKLK